MPDCGACTRELYLIEYAGIELNIGRGLHTENVPRGTEVRLGGNIFGIVPNRSLPDVAK
jgi:hypothetical protein